MRVFPEKYEELDIDKYDKQLMATVKKIYRDDELATFMLCCNPSKTSFGAATNRLPEILEFSPEGLSFAEIGYQLVKSPNDSAGTKYGENHAKLAEMLDLVKIHNRPSKVKSTKLGKYLLGFKPEEKVELLKRLLLRQFLIKKLIHDAGEGNVEYISEVRLLSKSTAARRGRNVRMLLDYILEGTDDEARIQRIDWDVK